jgi:anthranilate synthase component 2
MYILIDNYDSFTYNIVQYFGDLGYTLRVYRNDACPAEAIISERPEAIILSPGPCGPADAGICVDLVRLAAVNDIPLLGICLGHQAIGHAFDARVERGPRPVHGHVSTITHDASSVHAGIANPHRATRYHSLIVTERDLPSCLRVTARSTDDQIIMGLEHTDKPLHGIQYHPESIASEHGHQLLHNFIKLSRAGKE